MRTRTFIGLALLIVALIVASTPQLLDPTARGVATLGTQAGLIKPLPGSASDERASSKGKQLKPALQLHGYELQKNGDLRDTVSAQERSANARGRLIDGSHRVGLPGEPESSQTDLPYPAPSAMLLDDTGSGRISASAGAGGSAGAGTGASAPRVRPVIEFEEDELDVILRRRARLPDDAFEADEGPGEADDAPQEGPRAAH